MSSLETTIVVSLVFQILLYLYLFVFFALTYWKVTLPSYFLLVTWIIFAVIGLMDIILTGVS
jgi:hypothetical protein